MSYCKGHVTELSICDEAAGDDKEQDRRTGENTRPVRAPPPQRAAEVPANVQAAIRGRQVPRALGRHWRRQRSGVLVFPSGWGSRP